MITLVLAFPSLKSGFNEPTDANAQSKLGDKYYASGNYAEAVKWYRKAAEQGYAKAQYNLGLMYEFGNGMKQDYAEALKWYRKAAEQGDSYAKEAAERVQKLMR